MQLTAIIVNYFEVEVFLFLKTSNFKMKNIMVKIQNSHDS